MTKGSYKNSQFERGTGIPFGTCVLEQGKIQFSILLMEHSGCSLHILPVKRNGRISVGNQPSKEEIIVPAEDAYCIGDVFSVTVSLEEEKEYYYYYEKDGEVIVDPYANQVAGKEKWGSPVQRNNIYYKVTKLATDLKGSANSKIAFQDLLIYRLHVRGFTMDSSSGVKEKGTYRGVIEKIPYLQEIGVNAVELMPCYEFNEITDCSFQNRHPVSSSPSRYYYKELEEWKLNYWGYAEDNYYFAPKSSYAAEPENCCNEFKELVDALHRNGFEVYMEFYFGFNTNQSLIIDCLHFWQTYYHIDGFKVNQEWIPDKLLATDPLLSQTKLFTSNWNISDYYPDGRLPKRQHLADYNDSFLTVARKFLKGDEEQVASFTEYFKKNPEGKAVVNYVANTNTMTLMDLVSYDVKHNEENGEGNRDGTDYNYSWNCGVEGTTKKKSVLELRKKQIRNALTLLYFSQGVPLLLAGDEFGNSQKGNNNPYCLDNKTTWINWDGLKKNQWIFDFVKKCIAFRKQHKIFHLEEPLKGRDYISCGCPDISFHGLRTWYPDYSNYSRMIGVLLCGRYVKQSRTEFEQDYYLVYNFHWEEHEFSLPNPPKGTKWFVILNTAVDEENELKSGFEVVADKSYCVKARTVIMFQEAR